MGSRHFSCQRRRRRLYRLPSRRTDHAEAIVVPVFGRSSTASRIFGTARRRRRRWRRSTSTAPRKNWFNGRRRAARRRAGRALSRFTRKFISEVPSVCMENRVVNTSAFCRRGPEFGSGHGESGRRQAVSLLCQCIALTWAHLDGAELKRNWTKTAHCTHAYLGLMPTHTQRCTIMWLYLGECSVLHAVYGKG